VNQTPTIVKTTEQAKAHNGVAYRWDESPAAALTATTGSILLGVTTPAASGSFAGAVLRVGGSTQAVSRVQVFTGTTHTGGTARTPVNVNRQSGVSSTLTVVATPTGGADGTLLSEFYVGPGEFEDREFVLAPNTKYLVRLLNHTSAAANFATLRVSFYEVARLDQIQ
jgi:hypothetical protein